MAVEDSLSNTEIYKKLKALNIPCGPVTDSTRSCYLKKLKACAAESNHLAATDIVNLTDAQLSAALQTYNITVAPITSQKIREFYIKKLRNLRCNRSQPDLEEPMEVEEND